MSKPAISLQIVDLNYIEKLLIASFQQVVSNGHELTSSDQASLQNICDATLTTLCELSHHEANTRKDIDGQDQLETQTGNQVAGVMDSAVVDLHRQVLEAVAKVNDLRQKVPAAIADAVQQEMEALRPAVLSIEELVRTGGVTDAGTTEGCELSAEVAEVEAARQVMVDAMDKLPGLRARLDQAVARLNRIIAAIEMEQTRPSPRTVERVLLRANSSGAHTPSFRHGGDQADAEGATRKRLARDLNGAATALA